MIDVNATDRLQIGDRVEWTSKSGNAYSGTIVRIRENQHPPEYFMRGEFTVSNPNPRGALVTVEISEGVFRNFYENDVEAYTMA